MSRPGVSRLLALAAAFWALPAVAQMPPPPPPPPPAVQPPPEPAPVPEDPVVVVGGLQALVGSLPGPKGIRQSLGAKLRHAREALEAGEDDKALEHLAAFVSETEAQRGKHLTEAAADTLLRGAKKATDLIGA